MKALSKSKLICKAMELIARKEQSSYQLKIKLLKMSDVNLVEEVIAALQKKGILSDQRFAEITVHHHVEKGYGPKFIQAKLCEHHIQATLIENTLNIYFNEWEQIAKRQKNKHFGLIKLSSNEITDMKQKQRQANYLLRRGFLEEHFENIL